MKNPLADLMQQAQKMQESLQKVQDEIAKSEVHGESGGGLVKLVMNGKREVQRITLDESLFNEDRDLLEDLLIAAINDAVHKVSALKKERMESLTAGLPLPGGFRLPM